MKRLLPNAVQITSNYEEITFWGEIIQISNDHIITGENLLALKRNIEMRLGSKLQEMGWDLGNGENKIVIHIVTNLLRKRSRWRKNSALSPSRARKLARSRLPQPRPPNPPRKPCYFRPTIPGLSAVPTSPTAPVASRRPRAVPPWRGRGNKRTAPSLQSSFRFRFRFSFRFQSRSQTNLRLRL
jgi:hypothetical protein